MPNDKPQWLYQNYMDSKLGLILSFDYLPGHKIPT
jgi:hypothetical protein